MTNLQRKIHVVLSRFDERFFDSFYGRGRIVPWYINYRMEDADLPIARHLSQELKRRKKRHGR